MTQTAKEVYATMSDVAKAQHTAAWTRIEAFVTSLQPRKAKVFEVHHSIEHARKLYLAELAKGLPADLCERTVRAAYTTT